LDTSRPITALAQTVADTRHKIRNYCKLNLICIISCTTNKKRTEIWTTDFFKTFLNLNNLSSAGKKTYWLELAIFTFLTFLTLLRWLETPLDCQVGSDCLTKVTPMGQVTGVAVDRDVIAHWTNDDDKQN